MIAGYGYRRDPADLRAAGAEHVWVDLAPGRYERAAMMRSGNLRKNDILILFKFRDLSGSAKSDDRWLARIKDLGVTIKLVDLPASAKKIGRPRGKYNPDPPAARRHHAVWINGDRSEIDRLATIAADNGSVVSRQTLNGRYGNPTRPKPAPE